MLLDGREVLLLCSNNYLGLADHPSVRRAAAEAAMRWGTGAGASRLVSREHDPAPPARGAARRLPGHRVGAAVRLRATSPTRGRSRRSPRAGEVVFSDELNHASIIDGCRLSRAETFVYRHRDFDHLAWGLERAEGRGSLIATDGLFSMDGDVAPLAALSSSRAATTAACWSTRRTRTGAIGPDGRGAVAEAGLEDEVDVVVGTLGKALGSYGAYVCARREITELPDQRRAAVHLLDRAAAAVGRRGDRGAEADRRAAPSAPTACAATATCCAASSPPTGLDAGESRTQIVPLIVGDAEPRVALCERALERGVFAQAIRPPTVPEGTSRLRLTVMATHREAELRHAANVIGAAARDLDLAEPGASGRGRSRCRTPRPRSTTRRAGSAPGGRRPVAGIQMPPGPLSIDLDEAA